MKKYFVLLLLVLVFFTSACGGRVETQESDSSQQDKEKSTEFSTETGDDEFRITDVSTECQAGEVTFTVSYTASEDGYWYLWRFYETGGGTSYEGTFPKGNDSFSFTVSAEKELNATFGDLGEPKEWNIYISSANMTDGSNMDGALFDSWRVGGRNFFENIDAG